MGSSRWARFRAMHERFVRPRAVAKAALQRPAVSGRRRATQPRRNPTANTIAGILQKRCLHRRRRKESPRLREPPPGRLHERSRPPTYEAVSSVVIACTPVAGTAEDADESV